MGGDKCQTVKIMVRNRLFDQLDVIVRQLVDHRDGFLWRPALVSVQTDFNIWAHCVADGFKTRHVFLHSGADLCFNGIKAFCHMGFCFFSHISRVIDPNRHVGFKSIGISA